MKQKGKIKERLKKAWRWLRKEVLNKDMLLWVIVAEIIFWAPCIVGAILAVLFNAWFWTICTVYMAFWALPLTPAIPIQLGLAYGLKKLSEACKRRRTKRNPSHEETPATGEKKDSQEDKDEL